MTIELRCKDTGNSLGTIERKPFHKGFVGNFVPHWVRYLCKVYQLQGGWDTAYIRGKPDEAYIEV